MSKADWTFLELLLEQGQVHSTGVGQAWLTVLFLFRVLVLSTAAESVWGDEQSDFVCNTLQPGCEAVCYDRAFPISHFRFFVLQIIAVASPAIFYLSYAALHARRQRKREEEEEERRKSQEEEEERRRRRRRRREEEEERTREKQTKGGVEGVERRKMEEEEMEMRERGREREEGRRGGRVPAEAPRLRGGLLRVYLSVALLKLALEAAFILALWRLYGFTVPAHYVCRRWPCPHTVDCFVSRPKEKTVFTVYMQAAAAVSLLFNLLEVCVLLRRCCCGPASPRGPALPRARAPALPRAPRPHAAAPLPTERAHLHLPAGKGGGAAAPGWETGIGWGAQRAFGAEPVLFAPPPSLPCLPQGVAMGSRSTQWHYPQVYQQGGASI